MHTYHYTSAIGFKPRQLSEMHNASFSGYFVPITMTPETTADFWRLHQIDASRCVIMFDESETFVGMARIGTRGKRGWCGGFGIVPDYRGSGASRLLAEQMVTVARETGLEMLQLEVLAQNTRALKLYEHVGFRARHQLVGIEIETEALSVTEDLQVEWGMSETLLPWLWNGNRPSWGRELPTILSQNSEAITTTGPDGQLNGLIVQRTRERVIILASRVTDDLTQAQLASLLQQAANGAPKLQVYNEPEDSLFLARCRELGFNEFFRQHEMLMQL